MLGKPIVHHSTRQGYGRKVGLHNVGQHLAVQACIGANVINRLRVIQMLNHPLQGIVGSNLKFLLQKILGGIFRLVCAITHTLAFEPRIHICTRQTASRKRALGADAANPQMLPPAPGKIAGYAAVVYQRTCPGKAPEAILHVGVQSTGIFSKPEIMASSSVGMQDVLITQAANRPQWLAQVVERLVHVAPTNPAAKQVLVATHENLVQALPELATALNEAVQ
ncbi:hypothetical protein J1777_07220 [Comamonas denitrificans]|uniref:Uncharacterized protein n=1 Tax=Comamonas denitrificans TaxID=117506 RepID=A0A939GYH3_9BURK|nr:hypothetical protein [Comamonas denitrificans]MBO1249621.1 hypothetical protein [Comamonas denitrificans]